MRATVLLVMMVGCNGFGGDSGKTLVYVLDDAPEARIDRSVCAAGVGLNVPLGLESSLSYSVAPDGRDAIVGTCVIDDTGTVTECLTLAPEIRLTIAEDGALVADADVPVSIPDSDCTGATLSSQWRIELVSENRMETEVVSTWHLDSTAECEDFEAAVINASNNGQGIEGCLLTHTMQGTLAARCTNYNGLNCKAP